ncbi:MAG: hypothetical protein Q8K55_04365, partial [Gemmatimonadaceae bacterium]|nr:hypothetical protein [Gemmatimonadaceae bacterium]
MASNERKWNQLVEKNRQKNISEVIDENLKRREILVRYLLWKKLPKLSDSEFERLSQSEVDCLYQKAKHLRKSSACLFASLDVLLIWGFIKF